MLPPQAEFLAAADATAADGAADASEMDSSRTPVPLGTTQTMLQGTVTAAARPDDEDSCCCEEEDGGVECARADAARLEVIGALEGAIMTRMQDAYAGED